MTQPSGTWWCDKFPGSAHIGDLAQPFRDHVGAFIAALRKGGATVTVSSTYRPPERAWLMHWCCMIADSGQDPAKVPAYPGIDIDWTHGGNVTAARIAASDMKAAYGIKFPAALQSRHTQRLAIDMTIAVPPGSEIADARGTLFSISGSNGTVSGQDPRICAIGSTYGVIKLRSDPPHWSSDGH